MALCDVLPCFACGGACLAAGGVIRILKEVRHLVGHDNCQVVCVRISVQQRCNLQGGSMPDVRVWWSFHYVAANCLQVLQQSDVLMWSEILDSGSST